MFLWFSVEGDCVLFNAVLCNARQSPVKCNCTVIFFGEVLCSAVQCSAMYVTTIARRVFNEAQCFCEHSVVDSHGLIEIIALNKAIEFN